MSYNSSFFACFNKKQPFGLHPYEFFFCFIFKAFLNKLLHKALDTESLIWDNVGKGYDCAAASCNKRRIL